MNYDDWQWIIGDTPVEYKVNPWTEVSEPEYAMPETIHFTVPGFGVAFKKETNVVEVKNYVMAEFEKHLDKMLAEKVIAGDLDLPKGEGWNKYLNSFQAQINSKFAAPPKGTTSGEAFLVHEQELHKKMQEKQAWHDPAVDIVKEIKKTFAKMESAKEFQSSPQSVTYTGGGGGSITNAEDQKTSPFSVKYGGSSFDVPPTTAGNTGHPVVKTLKKAFPNAMDLATSCPEKSCEHTYKRVNVSLSTIIPHLNDFHKWKTSRIAEWLENTFDAKELAS